MVGIQNGVYVGKGKKMGALITDTIPLVILRIGRVESGSVVAPFFSIHYFSVLCSPDSI